MSKGTQRLIPVMMYNDNSRYITHENTKKGYLNALNHLSHCIGVAEQNCYISGMLNEQGYITYLQAELANLYKRTGHRITFEPDIKIDLVDQYGNSWGESREVFGYRYNDYGELEQYVDVIEGKRLKELKAAEILQEMLNYIKSNYLSWKEYDDYIKGHKRYWLLSDNDKDLLYKEQSKRYDMLQRWVDLDSLSEEDKAELNDPRNARFGRVRKKVWYSDSELERLKAKYQNLPEAIAKERILNELNITVTNQIWDSKLEYHNENPNSYWINELQNRLDGRNTSLIEMEMENQNDRLNKALDTLRMYLGIRAWNQLANNLGLGNQTADEEPLDDFDLSDPKGKFAFWDKSKGTGTSGTVRVGRWMSQAEYDKMVKTGYVQESTSSTTHVANPASQSAFSKQAKPGSIYVEFDVSTSSVKSTGSGWGKIVGPNSLEGRLAIKKGLPAPQMPKASNIKIIGEK